MSATHNFSMLWFILQGDMFLENKYTLTDYSRYYLTIAGYLLGAGKPYYALALVGLIIPQVIFQVKQISWQFYVIA